MYCVHLHERPGVDIEEVEGELLCCARWTQYTVADQETSTAALQHSSSFRASLRGIHAVMACAACLRRAQVDETTTTMLTQLFDQGVASGADTRRINEPPLLLDRKLTSKSPTDSSATAPSVGVVRSRCALVLLHQTGRTQPRGARCGGAAVRVAVRLPHHTRVPEAEGRHLQFPRCP